MRIVIIGAGTGIGKTHLGVTLVQALAARGKQVIGLKPIESGVGEDVSDAEQLARVSSFHVKQPPPYVFPDPVSPHLAARRLGIVIELQRVRQWVDENEGDWTVVETAGALLSPIGPALTNLDLALALKPDALLLVAADRLGVLHEVSACMLALRTLAPSMPEPVVVLQAPEVSDSSTGTNALELRGLGIATCVLAFGRKAQGAVDLPVAELIAALERGVGTGLKRFT